MMPNPARFVDAAFATVGFELRRRQPRPQPPPISDDELECLLLHRSGTPAAFSCPLHHCVAYNGFRYGGAGWHPFVRVLEERARGGADRYRGSSLEAYYDRWQPSCARDAMIGAEGSGMSTLDAMPGYAFLFPWVATTPSERRAAVESIMLSESRTYAGRSLSVADGYNQHGPVSPAKGEIELARLADCHDSLEREGWDRARGDMTVTILRRRDGTRYLILHGHHRAAAASVLGHRTAPAALGKPAEVRRDEASHWPQVRRGIWSEAAALRYFDHLFDFDSLGWAAERGLAGG